MEACSWQYNCTFILQWNSNSQDAQKAGSFSYDKQSGFSLYERSTHELHGVGIEDTKDTHYNRIKELRNPTLSEYHGVMAQRRPRVFELNFHARSAPVFASWETKQNWSTEVAKSVVVKPNSELRKDGVHIHEYSVRCHPNWTLHVSRKGMQLVWSISMVEGLDSIPEHFLQLSHLSCNRSNRKVYVLSPRGNQWMSKGHSLVSIIKDRKRKRKANQIHLATFCFHLRILDSHRSCGCIITKTLPLRCNF